MESVLATRIRTHYHNTNFLSSVQHGFRCTEGVDELLALLRLKWAKLVLRKHCTPSSTPPKRSRTRRRSSLTPKSHPKRKSLPTKSTSTTRRKKRKRKNQKKKKTKRLQQKRNAKLNTTPPSLDSPLHQNSTPEPAIHAIFLDIRKAFDRVWHWITL